MSYLTATKCHGWCVCRSCVAVESRSTNFFPDFMVKNLFSCLQISPFPPTVITCPSPLACITVVLFFFVRPMQSYSADSNLYPFSHNNVQLIFIILFALRWFFLFKPPSLHFFFLPFFLPFCHISHRYPCSCVLLYYFLLLFHFIFHIVFLFASAILYFMEFRHLSFSFFPFHFIFFLCLFLLPLRVFLFHAFIRSRPYLSYLSYACVFTS
jgi:hypothetical protein